MEKFAPYILLFIFLIGVPLFVRLFFRSSTSGENLNDKMLKWQQDKLDEKLKKQNQPWSDN